MLAIRPTTRTTMLYTLEAAAINDHIIIGPMNTFLLHLQGNHAPPTPNQVQKVRIRWIVKFAMAVVVMRQRFKVALLTVLRPWR
jgi:hypothetical protein